ncbi:MAG: replication factor C large subunit [Candidatus Bathyarchaeota archaeon]|nr:replication factor C large subunit [Candidatus Bathyarchaeota archaeon]
MKNELWVEKYRPQKIADAIGNEEAKSTFIEWFKGKKRTAKKAVLLYGPPGVGKTTLVNAASKEFNFRVIEMNASDTRTEKAINKIAGPATAFVALDTFSSGSQGNILFMDEVDGIAGNEDRGGVSAIVKIVEKSRIPVIMAANDPDLSKLRPLKKVCLLIRFQQVRIPLIILALQRICKAEGIKAEFEALERIAENSRGDVRSAINDLQGLSEENKVLTAKDTMMLSYRNKDISMDETLASFFSAKSLTDANILLSRSNVDFDELLMSVSDNLPRRYADCNELAEAYDLVSKADMFRGRIGTENWHLLKYFYSTMAQAAAVAPTSYKPFQIKTPPEKIITLFWTKSKRTTLDKICAKIAAQCHISKATAKKDVVLFLKIMLQKPSSEGIVLGLGLLPEEVDFLLKMDRF